MGFKITLNDLMKDFFTASDTVTVNAPELQKLLLDKNKEICFLKSELKNAENLKDSLCLKISFLEAKNEALEFKVNGIFELDLKA